MKDSVMVYVVATINIADRERYGAYEAGFMELFGRFDGEMLSVEEAPVVIEGEWPFTRTVLVRFPSRDAFNAWYNSADYQALMQHRLAASIGNIAVLNAL